MEAILYSPPVVFVVFLLLFALLLKLTGKYAARDNSTGRALMVRPLWPRSSLR